MSTFEFITQQWLSKKQGRTHFSHQFLEKPAIFEAFLKYEIKNKSVLCLGSGDGSECDFIQKNGAKKVFGLDNSQSLIQNAIYSFPKIEFDCQDISRLNLVKNDFDLVFSSLTMHYIKDWGNFFEHLKKFVKPGAKMIFSVHHPIKWGSETNRKPDFNEFKLGYKKNKKNSQDFEIYGNYLEFREVWDVLFGKLKIKYYHRSLSRMFQEITNSNWQINNILEPKPVQKAKEIVPDFYEVHTKIPLFIIFEIQNGLG
jgi:SAM-dependent methyltransferase